MSLSNSNNSTTSLLDTQVFTGGKEDVFRYSCVNLSCKTDQDGQIRAEFSSDGSNWDHSDAYLVVGGNTFWKQLPVKARYFRVLMENNSGSDQTSLRLYSSFAKEAPSDLSVSLDGTPSDGDSVQMLAYDGTGYVPVSSDSNGVVHVSDSNFPALGNNMMTMSMPVTMASDQSNIFVDDTTSQTSLANIDLNLSSIDGKLTEKSLSNYKNINLGSPALMQGSASKVYSLTVSNVSGFDRFVKFFNKASVGVLGTDSPVITIPVMMYSTVHLQWEHGLNFSSGVSIACTEDLSDLSTDTAEANEVICHCSFE